MYLHYTIARNVHNAFFQVLDKRSLQYLYVEHKEHLPHAHVLILLDDSANVKSIQDSIRKGVNRKLASENSEVRFMSSKSDILDGGNMHSYVFKHDIREWMKYIKHESNVELRGTPDLLEEFFSLFKSIRDEDAMTTKANQVTQKQRIIQEAKRDLKLHDIQFINSLIIKYNMSHANDITNANEEDRIAYICVPGREQLMRDLIPMYLKFRNDFERQCRDKNSDWSWWQIALVNLIKCEMSNEEKVIISQKNIDYLKSGADLLHSIFDHNKINVTKFMEDVGRIMECTENKYNSLYLVGESDAGKTTIAKIISQGFHKAMIGQAGNASQFIFQEVPEKTLIIQEEAAFIPQTVDDFKNIAGGETNISVNVKNKSNVQIKHRTPYITTSNREPWAEWCQNHEQTFLNRGVLYKFNYAVPKQKIKDLCSKYSHVLKSKGELYLSLQHLLFLTATIDKTDEEKDKIARNILYGLNNLMQLDLSSDRWTSITHFEFNQAFNVQAPDFDEEALQDLTMEIDDEDGQLVVCSNTNTKTVQEEFHERLTSALKKINN